MKGGVTSAWSYGYWVVLHHIFFLVDENLCKNRLINMFFRSFERSCLPYEIRPPTWNVAIAISSFALPPYEPLKLSCGRHLMLRCASFWPQSRPRGSSSCMRLSIYGDGLCLPFLLWLNLSQRLRILLSWIFILRSLLLQLLVILSVEIRKRCYSAQLVVRRYFNGQNNTVLNVVTFLFLQIKLRKLVDISVPSW